MYIKKLTLNFDENLNNMDAVVIGKKRKKAPAKVPDYLIYETVKGLPIYYKGYKFVLNKTKTFDDITMDSTLQAWLKSRLTIWLGNYLLPKGYDITTGEQGLILSDNQKRGADIAIFKASNLRIYEHFSRIPPEVILEIDIKADTENSTELDYILEKLAAYHQFGVKNIKGFEPSLKARDKADNDIINYIVPEIFNTKALDKKYDLISLFMIIEHVYDPYEFLQNIHDALENNGSIFIVCHNRKSFLARIMGRKSPIFDIEHLQLFCPESVENLLKRILP